jgi:hypothetical protein
MRGASNCSKHAITQLIVEALAERSMLPYVNVKSVAIMVAVLLGIVYLILTSPYFCGSGQPEWVFK